MNPFKQGKDMLPVASINSVYVDTVKAYDLFRPTLIIDEILRSELVYSEDFDKRSILSEFDNLLGKKHKIAMEIAVMFMNRLYDIITTLKSPSMQSVLNRKNWDRKHWDYWKSIKKILFVGGLTTPNFTSYLESNINKKLQNQGINVTIEFVPNSGDYGIKGLATLVSKEAVLFDFGQTNVKRGYVDSDENFHSFDTIPSQHLEYKELSDEDLITEAHDMHEFMVNAISDLVQKQNVDLVHVSIANYIINGVIYPARGAYGKLGFIDENYQMKLQEDVTNMMGRNIELYMHHDTTSMAYNFTGMTETAVISLGTAFGVAFLE